MSDVVYPNHLGIIMDGNGRWAKERGLNRSAGHKAGADNLINLLDYIYKMLLCDYRRSGDRCVSLQLHRHKEHRQAALVRKTL